MTHCFRKECEHGKLITQCRCARGDKVVQIVTPCPFPEHATLPVAPEKPAGVWVAYNGDGSACVPFAEEIEAYRYAAPMNMSVRFVPFGEQV